MTPPCILYAEATITYTGRAQSILARGNYLIIIKIDGSVLIHGADLVNPRNYMSAGTAIQISAHNIVCARKQEQILIDLHQVLYQYTPIDWSRQRISIIHTERELQEKLVAHLEHYIPGITFELVIPEAITELGSCDVLGLDDHDTYHIVEIKRAKINIAAVIQLRKYLEALTATGKSVRGYVAAPLINDNALGYAQKFNISYIHIGYT